MLCHLLLISIVLSTYSFLSCDHSMFHLIIQVCLSYIHIIYDFHGYILYHLLCSISMYCYHVLSSYTVIMYYFHILLSCAVIYCIHVLFHVLFSYIMSDCIISCYRTYHHIAVLCFSYHIISFHMSYSISFVYVSCL